MKLSKKNMLLVSFMLFSLFFGAGNLIFPPFLGQNAGAQTIPALLGFLLTAVVLPVLGVVVVARFDGLDRLGQQVSPRFGLIFAVLIYLSIGPGLGIPRAASVPFEMAVAPYLPDGASVSVWMAVYSFVFFFAALWLCLTPSKLVSRIGHVLTPALLLLLGFLFVNFLLRGSVHVAAPQQDYAAAPFFKGFSDGYQTMDALAALPFGIIVLQSVTAKGYDSGRKQFRVVGGSAVLAGILLLAVYMGLAYLGATVSAQYTNDIGRAQLIMVIIEALMGKVGMVLFGVVVGLACVPTAVALTSSAAAYFSELCRGKVSYKVFVIAICVFSAVVSNLGLDRIVAVAAPVLDIVYPPTLVLICVSLIIPKVHDFVSRGAALGALLTSVLCTLHTCGVKLPLVEALPLYDLGLSWLIPAAVFGLAASLLRSHARKAEKVFSKPNEEL